MRSLQFSPSPRGGALEPQHSCCGPAGEFPTPDKRISFFRYPANCNSAPEPRARCTRKQKDKSRSMSCGPYRTMEVGTFRLT